MIRRACGKVAQQRGVTLLEVLIAVVILSIGLLGLAGLQTVSIRANGSALARTQATTLATDMLDRMRANRVVARDGGYDTGFADGAPNAPVTIVEQDLADWKVLTANYLPTGQGRVLRDGDVVEVTVRWREPWDDDTEGDWTQVQVRSQL